MTLLKVAFRNVFRNRRRSLMTVSTIGVGASAVLLVGALLTFITLDFQSSVIRRIGHLTVYKDGYFDFGAGNSAAYGIADYEKLMSMISADPALKTMTKVMTPLQIVIGLAGNFKADRSKPFFGEGVLPADRVEMRQWDDFGLGTAGSDKPELPSDPDSGVTGYGIGRILGLCEPLKIPNCRSAPDAKAAGQKPADAQIQNLSSLVEQDQGGNPAAADPHHGPRLDLLAATVGGAPNVVSLYVDHAEFQGSKTIDDNYLIMHLPLAQQLVYGRGEQKVTGIELQLYHSKDMRSARARLNKLIGDRQLDLEVRDFTELTPLYKQVLAFFAFLFTFLSLILGVIVIFTVVNTMTMTVMERIDEIGTVRALGLQRMDVRWQFLLEGCLLGVIGATAGSLLAELIAWVINANDVKWSPPTTAGLVPLKMFISNDLLMGTWVVMLILASLASLLPANRAAKMEVVDALRHV